MISTLAGPGLSIVLGHAAIGSPTLVHLGVPLDLAEGPLAAAQRQGPRPSAPDVRATETIFPTPSDEGFDGDPPLVLSRAGIALPIRLRKTS